MGISFTKGTIWKGKPTEPCIMAYVEFLPFSSLTLDRLFFRFAGNDLVSVGQCPVFWPVAWGRVEGKLIRLVWDSTVGLPSGFPCVISDPPVSQGRESHKVTASVLLQEEHLGVNENRTRVHLFHPTWRNEGFCGSSFPVQT